MWDRGATKAEKERACQARPPDPHASPRGPGAFTVSRRVVRFPSHKTRMEKAKPGCQDEDVPDKERTPNHVYIHTTRAECNSLYYAADYRTWLEMIMR